MSDLVELTELTDLRLEEMPPGAEAKQAIGFRVPVVLLQWPGDFWDRRKLGGELFVPILAVHEVEGGGCWRMHLLCGAPVAPPRDPQEWHR